MARVHNLAWRRRQTKESDMDCFVAIFSSTLFVSWYEARAVDIYGDEVTAEMTAAEARSSTWSGKRRCKSGSSLNLVKKSDITSTRHAENLDNQQGAVKEI